MTPYISHAWRRIGCLAPIFRLQFRRWKPPSNAWPSQGRAWLPPTFDHRPRGGNQPVEGLFLSNEELHDLGSHSTGRSTTTASCEPGSSAMGILHKRRAEHRDDCGTCTSQHGTRCRRHPARNFAWRFWDHPPSTLSGPRPAWAKTAGLSPRTRPAAVRKRAQTLLQVPGVPCAK